MTSSHQSQVVMADNHGIVQSVEIVAQQLGLNKVVGLGEAHWFNSIFQHWQQVVLHHDVLAQCQDIVLEMGNQKYQQQVDQYITGSEQIGLSSIREMLQDSIVFPVWFAAYYVHFFKAVRAVNKARRDQDLPLVRLHIVEPAFSWKEVNSHVDYLNLNGGRDQAFYHYLEQNFLQKDKPVMLIMGAKHLLKTVKPHGIKNVAQLCEQHYPGRMFSVWPHIFRHKGLDKLAQDQPQLLLSGEGILADLTFDEVCPLPKRDTQTNAMINYASLLLHEQVDAYLLMKTVKREINVDQFVLDHSDRYAILAKAEFMHERQKQLLHTILFS